MSAEFPGVPVRVSDTDCLVKKTATMKTLTLMRHAKSSWKDAELHDQERPLLEKGLRRTRNIIDFLQEKDFKPDIILCSPAVRTLETARIMAHAFQVSDEQLRVVSQLYPATAHDYYDLFFDLPDTASHILVVGHNPAITNFANYFLTEKVDYIPTSGVVSIAFDTRQWEQLPLAGHKVLFTAFPKLIKPE